MHGAPESRFKKGSGFDFFDCVEVVTADRPCSLTELAEGLGKGRRTLESLLLPIAFDNCPEKGGTGSLGRLAGGSPFRVLRLRDGKGAGAPAPSSSSPSVDARDSVASAVITLVEHTCHELLYHSYKTWKKRPVVWRAHAIARNEEGVRGQGNTRSCD
jgi:hypothetical protein